MDFISVQCSNSMREVEVRTSIGLRFFLFSTVDGVARDLDTTSVIRGSRSSTPILVQSEALSLENPSKAKLSSSSTLCSGEEICRCNSLDSSLEPLHLDSILALGLVRVTFLHFVVLFRCKEIYFWFPGFLCHFLDYLLFDYHSTGDYFCRDRASAHSFGSPST